MGYWAVAITTPGGETRAITNLAQQGFETYLPKFVDRGIQRVLFPRYLFVWVADKWRCILGTRGIVSVIMNSDKPSVLRDEVVQELRQREINGVVALPENVQNGFRVGETVRVVGGPFTGFTGICQGMLAHERESVLLSMLGRKVIVRLSKEDLAAA